SAPYSADTWYYFALVFDGNGGAGAQGLTTFLIPLDGSSLTPSDIAANKSALAPSDVDFGSTAAATIGSPSAMEVGGAANSETQMADVAIWNTALSDSQILTLANGRQSNRSAISATIDGTGTLELAGPDPATGNRAGELSVVNTSTAAVGLLISGKSEVVSAVDGTGTTVVNPGSNLTANHIVQGALVIGGTATNPATVTIAASDASGNPAGAATPLSVIAGSDAAGSAAQPEIAGANQSVGSGPQISPSQAAPPSSTTLFADSLAASGSGRVVAAVASPNFAALTETGDHSLALAPTAPADELAEPAPTQIASGRRQQAEVAATSAPSVSMSSAAIDAILAEGDSSYSWATVCGSPADDLLSTGLFKTLGQVPQPMI
ncbi:MAG TPA: hypothetical protein VKB78_12905, partial [Pirellulales bacterium]|nr:hypothetical protein [Pirellulales bacterium]